ncbi:MAG: hypothetical protein WCF84_00855 [Anaerolineae bacterium]
MEYIIWGLVIIAILAVALFFFWQRQLNVPRITYVVFPPYDVPDVILVGGLLVENRGRATATNVKIDIQYEQADSGRIHHMHVTSDDPYILRGGGEQFNFANIRLRELRPRKRLFVFWAAGEQFQPRISVTSFQPAEKQRLPDPREVWESLRNRTDKIE